MMKELDFAVIGEKIRSRRRELHITQEQLADALDVNPSHISNIECGRAKPSLTALFQIADTLNCSIDTFLVGQYTYEPAAQDGAELDAELRRRLKSCGIEKKRKLLKLMDII